MGLEPYEPAIPRRINSKKYQTPKSARNQPLAFMFPGTGEKTEQPILKALIFPSRLLLELKN